MGRDGQDSVAVIPTEMLLGYCTLCLTECFRGVALGNLINVENDGRWNST